MPGRPRWTAVCQRCLRLEQKLRNGHQILVCLSRLSCWTHLDTPVPDLKMSLHRNVASALIRRRSEQLLSRLRRFLNFLNSARCGQSHVADDSSPRNFEIPTVASAPSLDQCWRRFSGCADVSSTAPAPASTRGGSECDGRQVHSKLPPELVSQQSVSQKPRSAILYKKKGARNPCVRDSETLSGSCRASQCQCSFGSRGYQGTCWTFRRCGDDSNRPTVAK